MIKYGTCVHSFEIFEFLTNTQLNRTFMQKTHSKNLGKGEGTLFIACVAVKVIEWQKSFCFEQSLAGRSHDIHMPTWLAHLSNEHEIRGPRLCFNTSGPFLLWASSIYSPDFEASRFEDFISPNFHILDGGDEPRQMCV